VTTGRINQISIVCFELFGPKTRQSEDRFQVVVCVVFFLDFPHIFV